MIRELLTKRPFARITSQGYLDGQLTTDPSQLNAPEARAMYKIVSQADFMRELYPQGHRINNPLLYRNIVKYDEKKDQMFEQEVFRASFPFQQVILTQHLVHLCGNDLHFELTDEKENTEKSSLLLTLQKGWLDHNMEISWYEAAKSVKATGDGALAFYMRDGKVGCRVLSYLNGDTLYPHYDSDTGELDAFARRYSDLAPDGTELVSYVDVWDKTMFYRYAQTRTGIEGAVNRLKEKFGISGYSLISQPVPHNFREIPVAYRRDDGGPCWSPSQDSIDKYELAISMLCQNNMAYAFNIMVLKGEDVEIKGDIYGSVKAITMGKEDDAAFMNRPDASSSFELQLQTLLKMIFLGSFTVMPPEVKSGDLPGVAIKLIYSPSIEKAITDCKEFDSFIDKMTRLFIYGYGIERGQSSKFEELPVYVWAEPYVHQNVAELINNLMQSVSGEFLSKQTASETNPYSKNSEYDRLMRQIKETQQSDLLEAEAQQQTETQTNAQDGNQQ